MTVLLSSQSTAIEKMRRLRAGALFMEAGTGKTLTTIELIRHEKPDYCLWLTPFQTKENLSAEINKWGGLPCEIQGIESLSNSDRLYMRLRADVEAAKNPFVVVDESLKIKNKDAKRTKRIIDIGSLAKCKLILNGTPISRNLLDLHTQMEFLSQKILKMELPKFRDNFVEYVSVTYHSKGRTRNYTKEFIKRYHNLDYLYSIIEPYVFESSLSISVGKQHIDLPFTLTDEELAEHNRLKEKYLDDKMLMARNNNIFLELTQKMQHNYSLSPEKFTIIDNLLKDSDHSKVLIYAKYINTQEELKKYYKDVRIMSIGKHSYGLNLQDYNRIIFWDKTWDYAQREQIEHRVYRTGQKHECIYYDLTSNAGLDYLIDRNIAKKEDLLNSFKMKTKEQLKEIL